MNTEILNLKAENARLRAEVAAYKLMQGLRLSASSGWVGGQERVNTLKRQLADAWTEAEMAIRAALASA